jgi:transcriptional regulator with XRE-family HTH domain
MATVSTTAVIDPSLTSGLGIIVAGNLREYRTHRECSQSQLARDWGIDQAQLSRIETCKHDLTLATVEWLAEQMEISPVELLTEDTEGR